MSWEINKEPASSTVEYFRSLPSSLHAVSSLLLLEGMVNHGENLCQLVEAHG